MSTTIRLWSLFLLLGVAACQAPRYIEEGAASVTSIVDGYLQLSNGQEIPLPFAREDNPTWIFLVRHAEKAYSADPPLTKKGKKRAGQLADIFKDFSLDALFASDFIRTKETAHPTAQQKGLEVQPYDVRELGFFSYQLRSKFRGQSVLVVGHSNTTPELVNRLAIKNIVQQIDERDYSNFFVVGISENGRREVLHLRFGELWRREQEN